MNKLLCVLCLFATTALAAEQTPVKGKVVDIREQERQHRAELVVMQDQLLEQILQIPFEKRAYIYPALFEEETMPKKVLTHPQIIIWKGKKPTRIAPQMQEFANKYLDIMSAKFYPVLDPDAWPSPEKESQWKDLQQMAPTVWKTDLSNVQDVTK